MKTNEKLSIIARFLESAMANKGLKVSYTVENVYRDFGAGTRHDTIVAQYGNREFQIFSPKDLDEIETRDFTIGDLNKLVNKHIRILTNN